MRSRQRSVPDDNREKHFDFPSMDGIHSWRLLVPLRVYVMSCQSKCPLVEISRSSNGGFEDIVTRWCPECGAVVVDADMDNRTQPGAFMRMRFPKCSGGRG
jgi:hypothetical protein